MSRWVIVLAFLVMVLAGDARPANSVTGIALDAWCQSEDEFRNIGQCHSYVAGVADVLLGGDTIAGWRACYTEGVSYEQFAAVVKRWLEDHPESWHFNASGLVAKALSNAFPCN